MSRPVRRYQGGGLHVSASSLRVLQECPREFHLRYLRGLPAEHVSARMVMGTAVHAGLEVFYRALMNGEEQPGLEELCAAATWSLKSTLNGPVPVLYEDGTDAESLESECRRLFAAFLRDPYRPQKVVGVEVPFGLAISDGDTGEVLFEEMAVGFFDLVVEDPDGVIAVVDHKVTARFAPPKSSQLDVQLLVYGWAGDQLAGKPVRLRHHVLVRNKKSVRIEVVDVPRANNDAREALEAACAGLELIHAAIAHPRPEVLLGRRRSWRCSGCAFKAACEEQIGLAPTRTSVAV